MYGVKYIEAIPVVIIASILSIPRAFQEIAEVLLRAADRQKQILIWFSITGVVNVGLDWYLIPRYGAIGAAWGNGLSQTFGILAIWVQARRYYAIEFPWKTAFRLLVAGLGMAAVTNYVVRSLPSPWGLIGAMITAVVSYVVLVKVLNVLQPWDRKRLALMGDRLPGPLQRLFMYVAVFATPPPDDLPLNG